MKKIDEIRLFFSNFTYNSNILTLNKHEKIINLRKFIDVNLKTLSSNSGNKAYKPYFDKLVKVYEKIKHEEKNKLG